MPGRAQEAETCERNTGAYFGLVELPGALRPRWATASLSGIQRRVGSYLL